ncbi:uncharacterized protein LOC135481096 [Liolophura sinensis]|uniref:uncharacterized protein LOC135481096 n=1 Tax=Liolophura sinensis TaxID=3198878 RepID=UPI00315941C8
MLRERLDEYEAAWNANNFEALGDFYRGDSVFVPPRADIQRGSAAIAAFLEEFITGRGLGAAKWTIQDVIYVTDELVFTIDTVEIEREGQPAATLKDFLLWRKIDGIYYIQYGISNLPA